MRGASNTIDYYERSYTVTYEQYHSAGNKNTVRLNRLLGGGEVNT